MSSWLAQAPKKRQDPIVFSTSEAGFCSQFNDYLYHFILAKKKAQKLFLVDQRRYPFYNSFLLPPNVELASTPPLNVSSYAKQILATLSTMTNEQIRAEAAELFRLSPAFAQQIAAERAKYAFSFDVGVHIRSGDKITTGEMRAIPIEAYAAEIRKSSPKRVFVMTDNPGLRETLKGLLGAGVEVFSLEFKSPCATAHDQGTFNLAPKAEKQEAYLQFMTELNIMQEIPRIVCTLSSNVGRYLYVTAKDVGGFKSLDVPAYAPV